VQFELSIQNHLALMDRRQAAIDHRFDVRDRKAVKTSDEIDIECSMCKPFRAPDWSIAKEKRIFDRAGHLEGGTVQLPVQERQLGVDAGHGPGLSAGAGNSQR